MPGVQCSIAAAAAERLGDDRAGRNRSEAVTGPAETNQAYLADDVLHRIPNELYKFSALSESRLEWMRRLILESELYFPSPSSFNDPLECRISPSFEGSSLAIANYWRKVAEKQFSHVSKIERKKQVRRKVKQSSTPEGRVELCGILRNTLSGNGTVCFATDPRSVLLWSYYAEGHSGIAVRFGMGISGLYDLQSCLEKQGAPVLPIDVHYADRYPDLNFFSSPRDEILRAVLGTKSGAWTHEGEWRITTRGQTGNFKIPPTLITGVILGMRMSPQNENVIREWIASRSPAIDLLRVSHKPNSFLLELVPA
jgi:hypothetical protein